jgi:hypothetical protein
MEEFEFLFVEEYGRRDPNAARRDKNKWKR